MCLSMNRSKSLSYSKCMYNSYIILTAMLTFNQWYLNFIKLHLCLLIVSVHVILYQHKP